MPMNIYYGDSPEQDKQACQKRLEMVVPIVLGIWFEHHVPENLFSWHILFLN